MIRVSSLSKKHIVHLKVLPQSSAALVPAPKGFPQAHCHSRYSCALSLALVGPDQTKLCGCWSLYKNCITV